MDVDTPLNVRTSAIHTLGRLCNLLHFSEYASRIIHPLARLLDSNIAPELRDAVMVRHARLSTIRLFCLSFLLFSFFLSFYVLFFRIRFVR